MTSTQRLQLGTAPDSWGVWFAEDDQQVGWKQYLDDAANAGYVWPELVPQGFLPQDPAQLRDELAQRGLKVCGGTAFAGLHNGKVLESAYMEPGQWANPISWTKELGWVICAEFGAELVLHPHADTHVD